ncbi:MAG: hypothetical protein EZS28_041388, partial [Streblomastix strix]
SVDPYVFHERLMKRQTTNLLIPDINQASKSIKRGNSWSVQAKDYIEDSDSSDVEEFNPKSYDLYSPSCDPNYKFEKEQNKKQDIFLILHYQQMVKVGNGLQWANDSFYKPFIKPFAKPIFAAFGPLGQTIGNGLDVASSFLDYGYGAEKGSQF